MLPPLPLRFILMLPFRYMLLRRRAFDAIAAAADIYACCCFTIRCFATMLLLLFRQAPALRRRFLMLIFIAPRFHFECANIISPDTLSVGYAACYRYAEYMMATAPICFFFAIILPPLAAMLSHAAAADDVRHRYIVC